MERVPRSESLTTLHLRLHRRRRWFRRAGILCIATLLLIAATLALATAGRRASALPRAGTCETTANKQADVATIINTEANLTLTVQAFCGEVQVPLHVVLIFDNSVDMGGTKMADMRKGVAAFAQTLDLTKSKVGLVAYAIEAEVLSDLTQDATALADASQRFFPRRGSNLLAGLKAAELVLQRGRQGALPPASRPDEIMVLLTGSVPDQGQPTLLAEAKRLKDSGVIMVTIAGGGNADLALVEAMASGSTRFYIEGSGARFPSLFRDVARDLATVKLLSAQVREVLPAQLPYSFGSGIPAPRVRGTELTWNYANWPANGITVTYAVICKAEGTFAAHALSEVALAFDRGTTETLQVAAPQVRCLPIPSLTPTPTQTPLPATPTVPPTPTALPTSTTVPQPVFLPLVLANHCRLAARRLDAVLVLDTSSSMLERTPSGAVKLELAQNAASQFVDELALPADRAGLVAFSNQAVVLQGLTGTLASLQLALAGMYREISIGSRLDLGLAAAETLLADLSDAGDRLRVVVLLTDGHADAAPALAVANTLRREGVSLYAIGLGRDVDDALLAAIAGDPNRYFASPDGDNLARIYLDIAKASGCGSGRQPSP